MSYYSVRVDGQPLLALEVGSQGSVSINGRLRKENIKQVAQSDLYSLVLDNRSYEALVGEHERGEYHVMINGYLYIVSVQPGTVAVERPARPLEVMEKEATIVAPMTGLVVDVLVSPREPVRKDQPLVILEAMKMQTELRSPRDGRVKEVLAVKGRPVSKGQALVVVGD